MWTQTMTPVGISLSAISFNDLDGYIKCRQPSGLWMDIWLEFTRIYWMNFSFRVSGQRTWHAELADDNVQA